MKLISPDKNYEESYQNLILDFKKDGDSLTPFTLTEDYTDFESLVKRLKGYSEGVGISSTFVKHESFWLIDSQNQIVGTSNLRLELTDSLKRSGGHIGYGVKPSERRKGYATKILEKTLEVAKSYGILEVLLTCDHDNIGSIKTIINNGGKLESQEFLEDKNITINRYWINMNKKV
jgi:predicted acetyltransferase